MSGATCAIFMVVPAPVKISIVGGTMRTATGDSRQALSDDNRLTRMRSYRRMFVSRSGRFIDGAADANFTKVRRSSEVPVKTFPSSASQSTAGSRDEAPQFTIAVSATLQERRTRTLKHGDTFAVFDHRGDMGSEPGSSEGLYHRDTRMLSQFRLLLEEGRPLLLSSMIQDDNAVFSADLSNPDLSVDGQIALRAENIHLNRIKFVWAAACYERLLVRNYTDRPLHVRLSFHFASDFADLFEVRGERRSARGVSSAALQAGHSVKLCYKGLDAVERVTQVSFSPAPNALTTSRAAFELTLKPHATRRIFVRVGTPSGADGVWTGRAFYRGMRSARRALQESSERAASIDSSNFVFNEIVRRSVSDLYMLMTDTPQGPYPYAGTPWFSTPFGRDGIITALMMLWLDPSIAKGVLGFLAATQATSVDAARDAEPGKILHEMRFGEMANLREVPFGRYYGSVDATPLFVLLLGEYFKRTGDLETVRSLWPNAEAALGWIDQYGDRDRDGFVEYYRQNQRGPRQSGLEGLARRRIPSRWPHCGRADRAVRGASLCLRSQAARRRTCAGTGTSATRRCSFGAGGGFAPPIRGEVLVRRAVHICVGS